jgi:hypothetical protein
MSRPTEAAYDKAAYDKAAHDKAAHDKAAHDMSRMISQPTKRRRFQPGRTF